MSAGGQAVRDWWDQHARSLVVPGCSWGSEAFFSTIKLEHDRMYGGANRLLGLPALGGRELLELGCGIGLDTVEFAAAGARVTAVDFAPACLDLAGRFLRQRGLAARLEAHDAEALPFADASFDVVVARGLLMFTPSDEALVREVFRLLRPGGQAQLLVHNRYSWYVALAALSGTRRVSEAGDPPIDRLYTLRRLRRLLRRFSAIDVERDRYPVATQRGGAAARLFNGCVVPLARRLPGGVVRPFGYYLIARATR
jgi:SAM-dependent methyltransferase